MENFGFVGVLRLARPDGRGDARSLPARSARRSAARRSRAARPVRPRAPARRRAPGSGSAPRSSLVGQVALAAEAHGGGEVAPQEDGLRRRPFHLAQEQPVASWPIAASRGGATRRPDNIAGTARTPRRGRRAGGHARPARWSRRCARAATSNGGTRSAISAAWYCALSKAPSGHAASSNPLRLV